MKFSRGTMLVVILAASALVPWQSEAQFSLNPDDHMMQGGGGVNIQLCNNTRSFPIIFVATGSNLNNDPEGARVWVRGWWRVERGRCIWAGKHSIGKTWYYAEAPGRTQTWAASNRPEDVLCVRDGQQFNIVATADGMSGRPNCPNDARIQQFGTFETNASDVRLGWKQTFSEARQRR